MMGWPGIGMFPSLAPPVADPGAYVLRVGIWRGHPLRELAATESGRAYLAGLLRRPADHVPADVKTLVRAVLGVTEENAE